MSYISYLHRREYQGSSYYDKAFDVFRFVHDFVSLPVDQNEVDWFSMH